MGGRYEKLSQDRLDHMHAAMQRAADAHQLEIALLREKEAGEQMKKRQQQVDNGYPVGDDHSSIES